MQLFIGLHICYIKLTEYYDNAHRIDSQHNNIFQTQMKRNCNNA